MGWSEFFFGTPQRVLRTIMAMIVIGLILSRPFRIWVVWQVTDLVGMVIGPLLLLVIIVYGLRRILGLGGRRH